MSKCRTIVKVYLFIYFNDNAKLGLELHMNGEVFYFCNLGFKLKFSNIIQTPLYWGYINDLSKPLSFNVNKSNIPLSKTSIIF